MTDDMFVLDEAQLEKESTALAAKIIADDSPEKQFSETLGRTSSPMYVEMLVSRAAAVVSGMAVSDETSPPIALVYGKRLGDFLHRARLARGLWDLQEGR